MKKAAVRLAGQCNNLEFLVAELLQFRDGQFQDPGSFPDSEVEQLAEWAWDKRIKNELYGGRHSTVAVHRMAIDRIRQLINFDRALSLYVAILEAHGHRPDRPFAIVPDAMIKAARISMGRAQAYREIKRLCDIGILRLVRRGHRNSPNLYQFLSPLGGESRGGGSFTYIDDRSETQNCTCPSHNCRTGPDRAAGWTAP